MFKKMSITTRDAVRVQVMKCVAEMPAEYKRFSVDPQITSFETLKNLLARAFDLKGDFVISYLCRDQDGCSQYCPLVSDWDLDAAFLEAEPPVVIHPTEDPTLHLRVEPSHISTTHPGVENGISKLTIFPDKPSLKGTLMSQMEKTISLVQKAFNLSDGDTVPIYPPLTDSKFHQYLDGNGEVIRPMEFRKTVFHGGIEPTLRKVVWKHLLNVYPCGLTAKERIAYMKQKGLEYQHLKSIWKDMLATGAVSDEVKYIVNMVRKDVLRTDRTHAFYAGPDDNANVVSLFNILITYALNHPSVSYCQGMSDLASPILVTMKDEAHAYVCFCALMHRLKPNFSTDGEAMTLKFQHLTELLEYYDPEFFEYLKERGADDILFCYRWLLLELKREFAFDDALHMLEVLWSSIPANPPQHGLPLWEVQFNPQTQHLHSRTNPFSKVRTLRKHNSFSAVSTNSHLPSDHKTLQRACKSEDISDIVESSINLSQGNDSTTSSSISLDAPMQPSTTGNIPTIPEDNVAYKQRAPYKLPPPNELGGGNPFMLYICLTILLQHRNTLLRSHMDYNEIAMYFDKLVRKHNVHQVLHQARTIFKEYLHSGDYDRSWLCDPRV